MSRHQPRPVLQSQASARIQPTGSGHCGRGGHGALTRFLPFARAACDSVPKTRIFNGFAFDNMRGLC